MNQEDYSRQYSSTNVAVWFYCFMLGVGQLIPWNTYLTALIYFFNRFPSYPSYGFVMPIAFNVANLVTLFLLNSHGDKVTIKTKFLLGHFLGFAMVLFIPGINSVPNIEESIRVILCLGATFVTGFTTALLTGTAFGATAALPPSYTTALMSGQGVAGILVGGLQLVFQFVIFKENTSDDVVREGLILFCVTAFALLGSVICSQLLLTSDYYLHYTHVSAMSTTQGISLVEDPLSTDALLSHRSSHKPSLLAIMKKIWPDAVSVFLIFFVTLALFPGFTILIPNYMKELGDKMPPNSYLPTVLIVRTEFMDRLHRIENTMFQVFDFIGRTLPQFIVIMPLRFIIIPSTARLGFFAIWMMMCFTTILANNWYAFGFMALMAISNGYFSTLAMMSGPQRVTPEEAPQAGTLMTFFLQTGIFAGCAFAIILLVLIKGWHYAVYGN